MAACCNLVTRRGSIDISLLIVKDLAFELDFSPQVFIMSMLFRGRSVIPIHRSIKPGFRKVRFSFRRLDHPRSSPGTVNRCSGSIFQYGDRFDIVRCNIIADSGRKIVACKSVEPLWMLGISPCNGIRRQSHIGSVLPVNEFIPRIWICASCPGRPLLMIIFNPEIVLFRISSIDCNPGLQSDWR